jgi:competence protein ComEA
MKIIFFLFFIISSLLAIVDINNADAQSFTELKGVGVKKSEAIIEYRDENGCFTSVDSLQKVKGIGPKTVEKNRQMMVLGKCNK